VEQAWWSAFKNAASERNAPSICAHENVLLRCQRIDTRRRPRHEIRDPESLFRQSTVVFRADGLGDKGGLVKDGKTVWSGVKNPLAQKHFTR
jgi:hypothetical protein